eukprot:Ihof_evm6s70 gene=Ihof_evmTU6s70
MIGRVINADHGHAGLTFPRQWTQLNTKDSPVQQGDHHSSNRIRVLSYNILAQCYVKSTQFPWSGKTNLKWANRSKRLKAELSKYQADILCLQEVDHYEDYWRPTLLQLGYDGHAYVPRTSVLKNKEDGSGVFWRSAQFRLVDQQNVHFNDLNFDSAMTKARACKPDDYFIRDCVASIVALEAVGLHSITNQRRGIIVSSAHIFWDPQCEDVKMAQAWWLLKNLSEFKKKNPYGLVIAADFNSTWESQLIKLMLGKPLDPKIEKNPITEMVTMTSLLPLLTVYRPDDDKVTNFTYEFRATIDHILHTPDITCDGILPLPKMSELKNE